MRVLVCPDSFTGTMSATEAAVAIEAGWRLSAPDDEIILRPLSDGGPGFLDAVAAGSGGTRRAVEVSGPLGEPVAAQYLLAPDGSAWIESAQAAGLHLVPPDRRDPTRTTSLGVGQLLMAALRDGARRIVVGVGGTGTCDGGAGMLAGLGATAGPEDPDPGPRARPPAAGQPTGRSMPLTSGGAALAALDLVDLGPALAVVAGLRLEVATDVDVPLLGARGAARGFAPQKGATPEQVEMLEAALTHWASLLGRSLDGRSAAVALGSGAGGGIGAGLLRLGARRVPGIETVLDAIGFAELLDRVDLVVTGEGAFDWQSLQGKVVAGVAAAATNRAVPTLVLAGRVDITRREWIRAGVAAAFPGAAQPGEPPSAGLSRAAARAALTWSPRVGVDHPRGEVS